MPPRRRATKPPCLTFNGAQSNDREIWPMTNENISISIYVQCIAKYTHGNVLLKMIALPLLFSKRIWVNEWVVSSSRILSHSATHRTQFYRARAISPLPSFLTQSLSHVGHSFSPLWHSSDDFRHIIQCNVQPNRNSNVWWKIDK